MNSQETIAKIEKQTKAKVNAWQRHMIQGLLDDECMTMHDESVDV